MPEISRFYCIVIRIYWNDHGPPHFHAEYGDSEALVNIEHLQMTEGRISPRAERMVAEWATKHRSELQEVAKSTTTAVR